MKSVLCFQSGQIAEIQYIGDFKRTPVNQSMTSAIGAVTGAARVYPWSVFDTRNNGESASTLRNFELVSRLGVYRTVAHSHWAHIASFDVASQVHQEGELQQDIAERNTDANLSLDVDQFWRFSGLYPTIPALDDTGRLNVRNHTFRLREPLRSIGRGITDDKPLAQVVGPNSQVGACPQACAKCHYCKFSLFMLCARNFFSPVSARVAVRLERRDDLVSMHFYIRPSVSLIDSSFRFMNPHTYLIAGVYRNAQRTGFSSEAAISSMRSTDTDCAFMKYVDKVLVDGWHDLVSTRLLELGVQAAPYPHQSAAVLAMLDMERGLGASGFAEAPTCGRRGIAGFLDTTFVDLDAETVMCALTGAILRRSHADSIIQGAAGGLLALPPGIGKTYTCVALSVLDWSPGKYAAVVACPEHLVLQWTDEIKRFLPRARVVNAHRSDTDLISSPAFLVAKQARSVHVAASEYASGVVSPFEEARAKRYIVDEAHDAPVPYPARMPGPGEAIWAVTATPFFARTAQSTSLFDILQKIPRHFGVPTVHAQIARILRRDIGIVFGQLVLNLHTLSNILAPVQSRQETVSDGRNFEDSRDIWNYVSQRTGDTSMLFISRINATIQRAANLGLILHLNDLLFSHHPFGRRRPRVRDAMPTWDDMQPAVPGAQVFDTEQCVVCLDNLEDGHSVLLPCGHAFHHPCMAAWHVQPLDSSRCPTCRTAYVVADLARWPSASLDTTRGGLAPAAPASNAHSRPQVPVRREGQWEFNGVHARAVWLVREHLAKGEGKAIVFLPQAAAARLADALCQSGIAFVSCVDAAGAVRRATAIHSFVEQEEPRVLLIDPISFETGLNLTVANFVVSYPYHRGSVEQMVGRIRRLGQRYKTGFVQLNVQCADLLV